jgi:ABC-type amino acid transport substrate-binding protein
MRAVRLQRKLVIVAALALSACGIPRDPNGTAGHVQSGLLRVGVSDNPPWVQPGGGEPQGLEPDLVREFASQQHAGIQWVRNGETPLLEALEAYKLDLVVGGLDSDTPWAGKLGATRPYSQVGGKKHIWLVAPGENQFLLRLDRFLVSHKAEAAARIAGEE